MKTSPSISVPPATLTAKAFIERLYTYRSEAELKKYYRYFRFSEKEPLKDDEFIGVRMGQVFTLAQEFIAMPLTEIETLMENGVHEVRAGALSIMGRQGSSRTITDSQLTGLYDLYLRRHDRINSWDLVDLAAYYVVGRYLLDKPRAILTTLARSKNPWERRTAIVCTAHFIRNDDTRDTFKIAKMLLGDDHPFVHTGIGWMLRYAGRKQPQTLRGFLDEHGATMPRVVLRAALEGFDKKTRQRYLAINPRPADKPGKSKKEETVTRLPTKTPALSRKTPASKTK